MIASPGIKFILLVATVVTHSVTIASNSRWVERVVLFEDLGDYRKVW